MTPPVGLRPAVVLLVAGLLVALLSFAGNSPPAFMAFIAGAGAFGGAGLVLALRFLIRHRRDQRRDQRGD